MIHDTFRITYNSEVLEDIIVVRFSAPAIALKAKPGHFVNIRIHGFTDPLLRRPFSISRIVGEEIEIVFDIVGRGTELLAKKKMGEMVDVIGPLGIPFSFDESFEEALLVGGGMGAAPLPMITSVLLQSSKKFQTFIGARSSKRLLLDNLKNVHIATDDGSQGFKGSAIELLERYLQESKHIRQKIFACGPNPMLKSLSRLMEQRDIPCEVSMESVMACGFGICQGCPVELAAGDRKYGLICKDGPVFNIRAIKIP
jgi:dihydroorotate dehydrogenase electron transfer subunit